MLYPFLRDHYGEWAGFHRRAIRRAAAEHAAWPAEKLADWAERLFRERVVEAVRSFPAYAAKLRASGVPLPNHPSEVRRESLPMWTREDQNRLVEQQRRTPPRGAFLHATGGSSGVPVRFYLTRESYEWRTAVSDRGYSWAHAEEGRWVFFVWGAPPLPERRRFRVRTWLVRWLQHRRFFDSFRFDDARKAECCRQIERFHPEAIVGYTGCLVDLARFVRDHPECLRWRVRSVVTAAEGLQPGQRNLLEEYLGDAVFQSYGSREFMLIGMECSRHAGYHLCSDNLLVEVVDDAGRPRSPGLPGQILVTDLHNTAAPFVRYAIGDHGALSTTPCDCGLPFPLLERVDGRVQEVIQTPSGTVTALCLPHLMKEFHWVEGYQVIQESTHSLCVCLLTPRDLTPESLQPLEMTFRRILGTEIAIRFCRVDRLMRNACGKIPNVLAGGTR